MSPDDDLLEAKRITYYNASLSEAGLAKMTAPMREAVIAGVYDDGTTSQGGRLVKPDGAHRYNLVSSLCVDGFHRPALDIDHPLPLGQDVDNFLRTHASTFERRALGPIVAVKSTNNWHAYLPGITYPHDEYMALIERLADVGVLEKGYVAASRMRGQTLLRPPHVSKPAP